MELARTQDLHVVLAGGKIDVKRLPPFTCKTYLDKAQNLHHTQEETRQSARRSRCGNLIE